jgi:hypothetical protein
MDYEIQDSYMFHLCKFYKCYNKSNIEYKLQEEFENYKFLFLQNDILDSKNLMINFIKCINKSGFCKNYKNILQSCIDGNYKFIDDIFSMQVASDFLNLLDEDKYFIDNFINIKIKEVEKFLSKKSKLTEKSINKNIKTSDKTKKDLIKIFNNGLYNEFEEYNNILINFKNNIIGN